MHLPLPRGPLTEQLVSVLRRPPQRLPGIEQCARELAAGTTGRDVLVHDDLHLGLHVLYESHYRGFDGVDPAWEWAPDLLAARAVLEEVLEETIRSRVPVPALPEACAPAVAEALGALVASDDSPSCSAFLEVEATPEQFREFLVHRSVYELKEADPHTWAIPRLSGRAKAALAEVQSDEYGGGRPERMHSELFARAMRALDLDDTPGAHLDRVPALTLASVNVMSLFGLHRRLRGAVVGHLGAFEMTSTVPNRRIGDGLRRLGFDGDATWFFDEHVEADAVHEQIAAHDLCGALAEDEPGLVGDLFLGAATALTMEGLFADHVLSAWTAGLSSLRGPGDLPLGRVA
ncbi:iron-containing redox enzyme family protein [Geodermatophilus chilensis]|uniref:iron-containing redox enzyme family protein n=1 Tax=Geodermatophilus chilensis TaxID=2035835 RepID=UPI001E574147|nr:iron-containing redox enzyme family protein [Geodermatophilus chilensis]